MARGGTGNGRALRLACVASKTANGYYRVIVPLQEMARRGHTIHWPGDRTFKAVERGEIPSWDVMHIQQTHDEEGLEIMARMRRAGIAVVWDSDDDISSVERGSEAWHLHGGRRGIRRHVKRVVAACRTAHLVTTTNEHLAQVYREHGAEHVLAIENYLAPHELQHPRRRHQGVVIGVALGGEHEPDMRRMRFPQMLEQLLERHDGVRVVALGVNMRLRSEHRYMHNDGVKFEELIPIESEFDVGLAPLRDTAFNRARSNVKLKEYAAAGAMWLASPVGPYAGMGEEQGGLLVRDDEWLATLEALLLDPDRRRALTERARAWVQDQTIRAGAARWQAAYRGAVERARAEAGAHAARA
jgi:glycosyltransferase involved in cell wall biosynthesis